MKEPHSLGRIIKVHVTYINESSQDFYILADRLDTLLEKLEDNNKFLVVSIVMADLSVDMKVNNTVVMIQKDQVACITTVGDIPNSLSQDQVWLVPGGGAVICSEENIGNFYEMS